ncbi:uncharacterized protein VICG_01597 [Vittaforma corneae ATCC 50505]|uniref:Uncharacterized protein n=1 Tax=Vittaforma corneae (strain ATCC 50505) TaxID=993615 RepID=L2GKH5_VITCO|nr:uncharacterized protein VICG_01597 [Vittaforma corneae ATCC 50505]ELA41356.1 hypothetical protein VICG_01597 [Vittaforma corneae ATCC 50505]
MAWAKRLLMVVAYMLDPALIVLVAFNSTIYKRCPTSQLSCLLDEYRAAVFRDLECVIGSQFCAVVEKDCNFGIFNKALENEQTEENTGIFRKAWGRLVFDANLTERYMNGRGMPSTFSYVLFSPYLSSEDFDGSESFYYTYSVEDRFTGHVREVFYRLFETLKDSQVDEFHSSMVDFRREANAHYIYYEFSLQGCGQYIATEFSEESGGKSREIMDSLFEIRERVRKLKGKIPRTKLVDEATSMLLEMLTRQKILKAGIDLEEFPDAIPMLFPYKMLDLRYSRGDADAHQLMTIGVDLTNISSRLSRFFDLGEHSLKYYTTFEV